MPELKPCPACGSRNAKPELVLDEKHPQLGYVRCRTITCGLRTGLFALEGKRAVEIWNSLPRKSDDQPLHGTGGLTMPRYIDADALLKLPHDVVEDSPWTGCKYGYSDETIKEQPTVSPDEVRGVGKWISNHDGSWNCSECGLRVLIYAKGNFCPNCGAKMEVTGDA